VVGVLFAQDGDDGAEPQLFHVPNAFGTGGW
jgi:hypothetical protein